MQHTPAARQARRRQRIATRRNARARAVQAPICAGKQRYAHQATADAAAQRWRQHVYRCPVCQGYHLSSRR